MSQNLIHRGDYQFFLGVTFISRIFVNIETKHEMNRFTFRNVLMKGSDNENRIQCSSSDDIRY